MRGNRTPQEDSTKRTGKQTAGLVKRFIRYYRPHRKLFLMDMGASVAVALIGIVGAVGVMKYGKSISDFFSALANKTAEVTPKTK